MSTELNAHYYEALCHGVDFAVIGCDPHQAICLWNAGAERIFGARGETMLGRSVLSIFPESVRSVAEPVIQAAVQDAVAGELEFKYGGRDGNRRLHTAVISPVFSAQGGRLGASICVRDITARREYTRSRRMSALGSMAGGVAHHFNSILGGVATRLDFILSTMRPGERLRRDLEQIADAIGRAARISGQLMTFAEGDHEAGFPKDLRLVIDEFLRDHRDSLKLRRVELKTTIEPIPASLVEANRLRAVLEGLLHNSLDVMPGGGTLTLTLGVDEHWALIGFEDTGGGIPEETLERIFEPFFTTKGELGGGAGKNTGLGLSAVHAFLVDMGGRIEAFSVPDKGARFEIRLPLGLTELKSARG